MNDKQKFNKKADKQLVVRAVDPLKCVVCKSLEVRYQVMYKDLISNLSIPNTKMVYSCGLHMLHAVKLITEYTAAEDLEQILTQDIHLSKDKE